MPVSRLLVEGSLDAQVLAAILGGDTQVAPGGSKYALAPRTRVERTERGTATCYVRDRDFDYDPPDDSTRPQVDRREEGQILGWRWCRHEIENYLIDPVVVERATDWGRAAYEEALVEAALRIRHYQVARWVVGTVRRSLPPHYDLTTRPDECGNHPFRVPRDVGEASAYKWAQEHVARYHGRVADALGSDAVQAELALRTDALSEARLGSPLGALLWCCGKDLLAALEPWIQGQDTASARAFLNRLRDWAIANPEQAVAALPEWHALLDALRAYPADRTC